MACVVDLPLKRQMLIVDDEEVIRFALGDYFSGLDYQIDLIDNVGEAEILLENGQYDILIADLRMSAADYEEGFQVVDLANRNQQRCKIIILSAYGSKAMRVQAGRLGAHAFVDKPIRLDTLATIVDDLINEDKATKTKQRRTEGA